ncbi:protease [Streptomyces chrestomyceticus JCM 4735]|uniref:Protease n=1 Tax=Streptomyces chrestomyceticus JCM 4735 TaxID=1306181 RepID=A0A7U9KUS3_9ACTN|nr:trypsin-like peptidase domain-containing protein [Streptomyces chrestomyceticus]GCD35760.1 protease [Streptomyces chrestomyceticus JCM 4735]
MTETYRRSGDETPQYQGYAHGPQAQGGTSGTGYPPPPPHPPYAAPQPADGAPAGPGAPGGTAGFGGSGDSGGPGGPDDTGTGAPAPRRRARRPVALIAAVALASGLIGGGSAALIGSATDRPQASTTTPAVNAGSAKSSGSVSAVAKAVTPAIVEIKARTASGESTGSGVVITPDGEIVTNNHVVAGASSVEVTFSDGTKKQADVVGTDPDKDLALIKVKGAKNLTTASLGNSDNLAVGDEVVAIGSPEGLTGSVTSGIVSALKRDVTVPKDEGRQQQEQQGGPGWPFEFGGNQYNGDTGQSKTTYKAIQTDAALNPGNSGGALIDMKGQVIGINSAMYSPSSAQGSSSAGSVGLGFAIPINTVKADLANLRAGGSSKS